MLSEVTADISGSSCALLNKTMGIPALRHLSDKPEDIDTDAAIIPSTW